MLRTEHVDCKQDKIDEVIAAYGNGGWKLIHVISPDWREGVKEWHFFWEADR